MILIDKIIYSTLALAITLSACGTPTPTTSPVILPPPVSSPIPPASPAPTPLPPVATPNPPSVPVTKKTSVLVVGCHAAGLGAALRLGQLGHTVTMTCEESVAGGMLTAGQIGFSDGTPVFNWHEQPTTYAGHRNGDLLTSTSWSLTGGLWKQLTDRIRISKGAGEPTNALRNRPQIVAQTVDQWLATLPNVKVLYRTRATAAAMTAVSGGKQSVAWVDVTGASYSGRLVADYYVDGSDSGQLAGLLGLPYRTGITADDGYTVRPNTESAVMDYAYRSTLVNNDFGIFPITKPTYYDVFLANYKGSTLERWPSYKSAFSIADDAPAYVHPLRLFNNQGRLTGNPGDSVIDNNSGYPPESQNQIWDVNGSMNNLSSRLLSRALRTNAQVASLFDRYSLTNPYGPTDADIYYKWCNIVWIEDSSPLSATDKTWLVQQIKDAAKAASLGFLWYIRSGDLQATLRGIKGATNVQVMNSWSLSNELGTQDGLPELMYQREGRRIQSEYTAVAGVTKDTDGWMTIYALSPTYDSDKLRTDKMSQSSPADFSDAIVLNDYPVDIHGTAGEPPEAFILPRPHQLPFRTLIPKGTVGLLVGAAIGADRRAFSAVRLDPVRLMSGGAIGDAIHISAQTENKDFTQINSIELRDSLARQYQTTRYSKNAHTWDAATNSWSLLNVSEAMQRLHARGWLDASWVSSSVGLRTPQPTLTLNGQIGKTLADYVENHGGPPANTMPWRQDGTLTATKLSQITGSEADTGEATVGDAYLWLARQIH